MTDARFMARWEVADVVGAVVAVDVIRAFTTAAYAFAAGASHIFLVDSIAQALAVKAADPDVLAMGEDRGRRPPGFDFSNSPVAVAAADLGGRVLVQRTSAGTRGVVAARSATRLWCASLVCASATAAAVRSSGLGAPTYAALDLGGSVDGADAAVAFGGSFVVVEAAVAFGGSLADVDAASGFFTSSSSPLTDDLNSRIPRPND